MQFVNINCFLFQAIAAALMMNIYIVGLNQLSDIEIDKVLLKMNLSIVSSESFCEENVISDCLLLDLKVIALAADSVFMQLLGGSVC